MACRMELCWGDATPGHLGCGGSRTACVRPPLVTALVNTAKYTFFKKKGLFCWLDPTCHLCKTRVPTAVIHRDHLPLPLQRGKPVRKSNRSGRRSPPNAGPGPETSANVYGDNNIQRVCVSDGAEQTCRRGAGGGRGGCSPE